jgi:chromosome partitioning protein
MLTSANREDLQKIVVLNPKGGCGKTTLATNLASYFALHGPLPALMDCDPLGFSMRWLEKRSPNRAPIYGIPAYKSSPHATRSWQLRVPRESTRLIVDTPAALNSPQIHDLIYDANNILIPVLPSPIDIRFAAQFIAELLLATQIERGNRKLAVIANRTRSNTRALKQLMRFLTSLKIPIVGILRDSQAYVQASDLGIGVYEMPSYKAGSDIDDMSAITSWLDQWQPPHKDTRVVTRTEQPRVPPLPTHTAT